jgi:serine/threonine-protein kinase
VRALDAFARVASVSARIASADTLVDLVDRGGEPESLDQAMLELDRAMAIAPDAPGLRERWTRLRARLGRGPAPAGPGIGVTMLAPKRPLPFTLVAEVARGGAGVVYEARQALGPLGERTIALKLVHDRERQREELRREGAVAARLRGAGVIAVHDLDLEEGWLAMEWAAGGSLRARLSGGDAPPVGRWLPTLLETLASIHALGWVHGDVKPANVLFDGEGAPLLGDFGLARPIGAPATPGSAGYVSPERSAGAACSPADDVFGIGRLLVDVAKAQALGPRTRALADACVAPVSARPIDARALGALLLSGR